MEYRQLGKSGLQVSEIGLGTNNFGPRMDAAAADTVVARALDIGVNLIDTANLYGGGRSEEYIGLALKGKRHRALIATKVASNVGQGPNAGGLSRHHIMREVENSLGRLDTDYIDLYQTHWPDTRTPMEETLRALDDLVRQGKVRYIGCSNIAAWRACEAVWTSRTLGIASYVSVQPEYSMLDRRIEAELVPFCEQYGLGILPYFPLASGFLTGKYRRGQPPPEGARLSKDDRGKFTDANFTMLENLERFAVERGHTMLDLAFAWLLHKRVISSVIAGATRPEQIDANAKASEWRLPDEDAAAVDALLTHSKRNESIE